VERYGDANKRRISDEVMADMLFEAMAQAVVEFKDGKTVAEPPGRVNYRAN